MAGDVKKGMGLDSWAAVAGWDWLRRKNWHGMDSISLSFIGTGNLI